MRSSIGFVISLCALVAATPVAADIQGLGVPVAMERDEPIDGWSVFRGTGAEKDKVHYILCKASAEDCSRDTEAKEIADKRSIPYDTWLSEVARTYQLEAKVLLNAAATSRRIDATVSALKSILAEDSDASREEKSEANGKLEALTKKDGYKDRFQQALKVAEAVEPPAMAAAPPALTLESSDKRAFRVRWPFNFDFSFVKSNDETDRTTDIVTNLEWIHVKKPLVRWSGVEETCRKFEARVPTASEGKAAAPWLAASPLGAAMSSEGSTSVGAKGKAFWTTPSTAAATRVDVTAGPGGGEIVPVVQLNRTKVYHFWQGRFDYFDLGDTDGKSFTPGLIVKPTITSKQQGKTYITFIEVVDDPTSEQVLAQTAGGTPYLSALCVRKHDLEPR